MITLKILGGYDYVENIRGGGYDYFENMKGDMITLKV